MTQASVMKPCLRRNPSCRRDGQPHSMALAWS